MNGSSTAHCREDAPVIRIDQFAHHLISRLELPRLDLAVVWLIGDLVEIVVKTFSLNGAPNVNCFIKQAAKDLRQAVIADLRFSSACVRTVATNVAFALAH